MSNGIPHIILLEGGDMAEFLEDMSYLHDEGAGIHKLRVAIDTDGTVKWKANEGVWSRPFGRLVKG